MKITKIIKLAETRTFTNITECYKTRKSNQIIEEVKKIKFNCRKKVQNKRQFLRALLVIEKALFNSFGQKSPG